MLKVARDLHAVFDEYGPANDKAGKVAEPVLDAIHASGIMKAALPLELGGAELRPTSLLKVHHQLSYSDPSTAWVAWAYVFLGGLASAFLERDVAEKLQAIPRFALAGQGTKAGEATPTGGGYRLKGHWFFGSGVKHASHVHTAARDTATGEIRFFLVPREQVNFIDNWDVLGLRATGSIDYTLDDVFVPHEMSYATLSTTPTTGGDLYRVGIGNFASINHGAWATGIGERLLDELIPVLEKRAGSPGAVIDNAAFHEGFATAQLRIKSARALLHEVWSEIEESLYVNGDDVMPMRLQSLNRMALINATRAAGEVSDFVYRAGGSESLRQGPIQRLFRDMHGGLQHVSSSAITLQSAGRHFAGRAEGQSWVHFELK